MQDYPFITEIEDEYKNLVDLCCTKELDFNIDNSSKVHAKYIISKIINSSKKVDILFSKFIPDLFLSEEIKQSIIDNKDVKIKMLVNDIKTNDFNEFKQIGKEKIEILEISKKFDINYVIGDSKRIRLNFPSSPFQAKVNFNKPSICKGLLTEVNGEKYENRNKK